jgi:hypothetical protein
MPGAADLAQRATILFFFISFCASNPFLRLLILKLLRGYADRTAAAEHSLSGFDARNVAR